MPPVFRERRRNADTLVVIPVWLCNGSVDAAAAARRGVSTTQSRTVHKSFSAPAAYMEAEKQTTGEEEPS